MAEKLGLDAKLYYGVAGSTATTELTNCKDVTLTLEKGEADVTTRGSGGFRQRKATIIDATLEFDMVWDTADAGFTALQESFFNKSAIALLPRDEEDGQGLDADWEVFNFSRSEPLEEALMVKVTAKITRSARVPAWV